MIKKIDNWIKKYSYQWYRPEYKMARSVSQYCAWVGILVIMVIMIGSRIEPITEDVMQCLSPIIFTAVELIIVGCSASVIFMMVDNHEKKLKEKSGVA